MLIYLDTNIVIYAVENPATFDHIAISRLQVAQMKSDILVISDLV